MSRYGFADVLAVQDMLRDLATWRPKTWAEFAATRKRWSDELFDWLTYPAADVELSLVLRRSL